MKVYCAVDDDEYELIRYMADSMNGLCKMLNASSKSLRSCKSRGQAWQGLKLITVIIDDRDDD